MRILVCIKQVPGTSNVQVDPVTGVLRRDGAPGKLNPYDLFALEQAVLMKERAGGSVAALTMGPPQAADALREALAMGADEAYLLSDRRFAGADVLATSYALSQGARLAGGFDVIICGKQTTDGDTAQVGAELAEFLGIPHAANVASIETDGGPHITVTMNFETWVQTQRMPLPCLLTMDKDANVPRLPSYLRRRAITDDILRTFTLDDLPDGDESRYGLKGSPTQVERIFPPEPGGERALYEGEGSYLAEGLFGLLREWKFI